MMDGNRWMRVGAKAGAIQGALWAGVWMLTPLLFFGAAMLLRGNGFNGGAWTSPDFIGSLAFFVWFLMLYLIIGTVIAILPAMLIGAMTGALLGAVLRLPHIAPFRWNRFAAGGGIALLIALVVNSPFVLQSLQLDQDPGINGPHLFLLGLPSLIYLCAMLYVSDQLPALAARESAAKKRYIKEYPVPDFYYVREIEE